MRIDDSVPATVDVSYSNIGEEWCAAACHEETGETLAFGKAKTRAEALRNLADAMDDRF